MRLTNVHVDHNIWNRQELLVEAVTIDAQKTTVTFEVLQREVIL